MKRNTTATETARLLRKQSTKAEKILWNELRNRKFNNLKFRRQHPIGEYVVDFYCHEKKLIIEVDGQIHDNNEQKEYDANRQTELENSGYKIVRIKNKDIIDDVKSALLRIRLFLDPKYGLLKFSFSPLLV